MKYDYSELRGEILKKYKSVGQFGKEVLNLGTTATSNKFRGYNNFTLGQIQTMINVLGIKPEEIGKYFFAERVSKN